MSLLYVVKPKTNPQNPAAPAKYYLQSKIRGHKSYKATLKAAVRNTTLSEKEMDMAVDAWFAEVLNSLEDGFSVEVAGLGTFAVSLKSEGVASEAEATANKKTKAAIMYRAKPEVRDRINKIPLEKYKPDGTL